MTIGFHWQEGPLLGELHRRATAGLHAAGEELLREFERTLDRNGGGQTSRPGEPPRRQTGSLAGGLAIETDNRGPTVRVGVSAGARHGLFLQTGTAAIRPRPWIDTALSAAMSRLEQTFSEGATQ